MSTEAPEAPAPAVPFEFFDLHVVRTRKLSTSLLRVTLGGEALQRFTSGGKDQRFKLFLPHRGQEAPVVPTEAGGEWFARWRAMDPAVRGIMRSYTVREQRRVPDEELDIDFVLHGTGDSAGPAGPASRWAAGARPGDRVTVLGPVVEDNGGVDFRPPEGTDWVLLSGDETALPAIAGIMASLPPGTRAKVWLEVPHPDDLHDLPSLADADITWLVRGNPGRDNAAQHRTDAVVESVRSATFPEGTPYAWIAGEAGTVKALRRHLVQERAFDRRAVRFTGYWRLGATEEQLVEEAVSGTTS
jgi:NADPH-dependent ferric siderophore reductase